MTDPTNEVNLCKGCNTMKHLDADGYCGRCVTANMTYEELQKQIRWILQPCKIIGIQSFTDELSQLFATLCAEVIGPDEIRPSESSKRNSIEQGLRRARTRLAQLTTKNTEEENV